MSKSAFEEKKMDIHTKLMSRYTQVPQWWFIVILVANIALTIFACEYYIDQLQLPWWGVLLACFIAIFFTLPIGIITATTNQVCTRYSLACISFTKSTNPIDSLSIDEVDARPKHHYRIRHGVPVSRPPGRQHVL